VGAGPGLRGEGCAGVGSGQGGGRGVEDEPNAFRFQGLLQLLSHVRVLAWQDTLATVYHRNLAAEPPEHLPKLQADVPTAEDEQVFRQLVQLHERGVGQIMDLVQPVDVWNVRACPGVNENALALQWLPGDIDPVRAGEPGLSAI